MENKNHPHKIPQEYFSPIHQQFREANDYDYYYLKTRVFPHLIAGGIFLLLLKIIELLDGAGILGVIISALETVNEFALSFLR